MVSGPKPAYEGVEALLRELGRPFFVGEGAGLAQTMKLVNNMLSGAALAITAEAMAMGARAGIAPEVMIEILNAGSGRNTATADKFPRSVLTGSYNYGFAAELMLKDNRLFVDEAEAMGLDLPACREVRDRWAETVAELGPCDFTAIARLMELRAGVSLRSREEA
jgi:3-hydroxyisobutyrate dehydrogenase-like beta-hydroxyacid dehydrogenase